MGVNKRDSDVLVSILHELAKQKLGTGYQSKLAETTGFKQSNISRLFSLKYSPTLDTFLAIAKAINVNFFFEDQKSETDLNKAFEYAMTKLGRRQDKLPKN